MTAGDRAGDEHEVEVRDDEVGVGDLPVDREDREHHAGDPAEREQDEEARRRSTAACARTIEPRNSVATQLRTLTPVGIAIAIEESMKKASATAGSGVANMWCAHTSIDRNAMPMLEAAIAL